jgi:thioesterase domain-containing protein
MSERAARIANLSPEQRRILELMLQERAHEPPDKDIIPALPRKSESGRPAVFPLSAAQSIEQGLRRKHQSANALSHLTLAMRLRGPLDVAALETSLREICVRHEALRTTFATHDGEPVQIVGPPRPVPLTRVDLRKLPPPESEEEAGRLLGREARRPIDLSRDPVLRATLLRLGDEEHVLLLVIHHIVSDGWSMGVLRRELRALYEAFTEGKPSPLAELPIQYADYAAWQHQRLQGGVLDKQLSYWKKQLADAPEVLNVPTDRPRPPTPPPAPMRTSGGTWQELRIPASLQQELHALCRRHNVTPFMTLLAAWAALLHRYSGQDDILIATPFANRDRAEVEGVIGFFANILALRHDFAGHPSFAELLGRVRETTVDAYSHGEVPFQKLVRELRLKIWAEFVMQRSAPRPSKELGGLRIGRIEMDGGQASMFLGLRVLEGNDGLTARLVYNPDLFDATTVARMLEDFRTLLESVAADPEQRISRLPIRPARPAESFVAEPEQHASKAPTTQAGGGRPVRRQLRRAARKSGKEALQASLVPVQPHGSRPPFFCIHGVFDDDVLSFRLRALAQHLGTDQPFYGCRARGQGEGRTVLPRVKDVAAAYVRELRKLQPKGPYFLGGYSFGAPVAFEMARQLRAQGRDVALLALFDTGLRAKVSMPTRLRLHARRLRRLGPLRYVRGMTESILRIIAYRMWLRFGYSLSPRFSSTVFANMRVSSSYKAQPYPGRVTLFRAADSWEESGRGPYLGWDHVAVGGVEVHEVPGDHVTLLEEPHVRVLAARLKTCLAKHEQVRHGEGEERIEGVFRVRDAIG